MAGEHADRSVRIGDNWYGEGGGANCGPWTYEIKVRCFCNTRRCPIMILPELQVCKTNTFFFYLVTERALQAIFSFCRGLLSLVNYFSKFEAHQENMTVTLD